MYYNYVYRQTEDVGWSLQRQLHVRSASHLPNQTSHTPHARLPVEGVSLHPVAKLDNLYPDEASNIRSVCPVERDDGSQQDSSLEEADGSEQDEETGQTGLLEHAHTIIKDT